MDMTNTALLGDLGFRGGLLPKIEPGRVGDDAALKVSFMYSWVHPLARIIEPCGRILGLV